MQYKPPSLTNEDGGLYWDALRVRLNKYVSCLFEREHNSNTIYLFY